MSLRIYLVSAALLAWGAASAHAVSFSGNATTSLLMTDRPTTTEQAVSHMPLYQNLTFTLGSMANNRLSFEGSLRGWRDLKDNATDQSDVRLFRAVARWKDPASGIEVGAGRQFVSEGVGRTYLDGLLVKHRQRGGVALSAFFGQPLRHDLDTWERWEKTALQWGAQADWRRSAKLRLALSYTEMRYDGDTGLRLVGGNAIYRYSDEQTFRLRADVDAADPALDRAVICWTKQPDRNTYYSLEAYYRQARLWAFSRLKDISGGHLLRVTASMVRPIKDEFRLSTALSGLNAGARAGGTADLGIWWRTLRVGYLFSTTGAVLGNGAYVQGSYRVNSVLLLGGRTNWSRYELDESDAASQTIGSAAFVTLTPVRGLDITCELHQITDDHYKYQFEGLFSLCYRFERVTGR